MSGTLTVDLRIGSHECGAGSAVAPAGFVPLLTAEPGSTTTGRPDTAAATCKASRRRGRT